MHYCLSNCLVRQSQGSYARSLHLRWLGWSWRKIIFKTDHRPYCASRVKCLPPPALRPCWEWAPCWPACHLTSSNQIAEFSLGVRTHLLPSSLYLPHTALRLLWGLEFLKHPSYMAKIHSFCLIINIITKKQMWHNNFTLPVQGYLQAQPTSWPFQHGAITDGPVCASFMLIALLAQQGNIEVREAVFLLCYNQQCVSIWNFDSKNIWRFTIK